MSRIRSSLALLLAVALLLPGEVHVLTGACLPGAHTAGAMVGMGAPGPASQGAADCASHHPGQGPVRGGMQHCSAPSTCSAGVALLEHGLLAAGALVYAATPTMFVTTPHSLLTPPGTPPPRR